ncbi:FHA domain-containing protein [Streptomyces sp. HD1123-B1]|uniref:FHA domain-containing protein n=1 Tax=Streptomyces huangiella TaxID=3228804 RepID=UPI003D7D5E50
MQIRLTVLGPRSAHPGRSGHSAAAHAPVCAVDVLVTAPVGTALASVASGLATAVAAAGSDAGAGSGGGSGGAGGGAVVLYAGTERLDPQRCALGEPPLVDGAVLSLHAPADPERSPAYAGLPGLPEAAVAEAAVHLDVVAGPDAGGVHLLHGGQVRVGRSADADVPLDDPDVSRLHCAVTVAEDGRVTVADLGSTNGTAADGASVGPHPVPLTPGALLRIGESALRLRTPGAAPSAPPRLPAHPDGEGHLRVTPRPGTAAVGRTEGPWTGAPSGDPTHSAEGAWTPPGHHPGAGRVPVTDGDQDAYGGARDVRHSHRGAGVPAQRDEDHARPGGAWDHGETENPSPRATRAGSDGPRATGGGAGGERGRAPGRRGAEGQWAPDDPYGRRADDPTAPGGTDRPRRQTPRQPGAEAQWDHGDPYGRRADDGRGGPGDPCGPGADGRFPDDGVPYDDPTGGAHGRPPGRRADNPTAHGGSGRERGRRADDRYSGPTASSGTGGSGAAPRQPGGDGRWDSGRPNGPGAEGRSPDGGAPYGDPMAHGGSGGEPGRRGAGEPGRSRPTGGRMDGTHAHPRPYALDVPGAQPRRRGIGAWVRQFAAGKGERTTGQDDGGARDAAERAATEAEGLQQRWPDPAAVLMTALGPGPRLWERGPDHPDALSVRLGSADRPAADGGLLPAAPVTVSLRQTGSLGLAGPRARLAGLARSVVAQLSALHSPSALEIVLISTDRARTVDDRLAEWSWLGWLPQVRPLRGQDCRLLLAYDAEQAAARAGELARRLEDGPLGPSWAGAPPAAVAAAAARHAGPYTVVLVDGDPGPASLRETLVELAAGGPAAGIHVVCLAEAPAASPASPLSRSYAAARSESPVFAACSVAALLSGDVATGLQIVHRDDLHHPLESAGATTTVTVDAVSGAWVERFARALAPLRPSASAQGGTDGPGRLPTTPLPDTARLLDELGLARATPASLLARWAAAADEVPAGGRAQAVLGAGPRGPLAVDLAADGPHMAVDGAAGTGKTELLRSLAASLAAAERPDRLELVLVDGAGAGAGSGGGAAGGTEGLRVCTDLPHVSTYLAASDPVRMREFAQALSSELKRRAELLGPQDFTAWHTDHPTTTAEDGGAPTEPGGPPTGTPVIGAQATGRAGTGGEPGGRTSGGRPTAGTTGTPPPGGHHAGRTPAGGVPGGPGTGRPTPGGQPTGSGSGIGTPPTARSAPGGPAAGRTPAGGVPGGPGTGQPTPGGQPTGSDTPPTARSAPGGPATGRSHSGSSATDHPSARGARVVAPRAAGDVDLPSVDTPHTLNLRTQTGAPQQPRVPRSLPRLVVLVDDYDALVAPALGSPGRPAAGSVVRALEAVARDGARLGVHLVAASGRPERTAETAAVGRAGLRVALEIRTGPDGTAPAPATPSSSSSSSEEQTPGRGRLFGPGRGDGPGDGAVIPFQAGRVTGRIPRTATQRPTVVPLEWERMGDPPTRRPLRELGNGPTDLALLASALQRAAQSADAATAPALI